MPAKLQFTNRIRINRALLTRRSRSKCRFVSVGRSETVHETTLFTRVLNSIDSRRKKKFNFRRKIENRLGSNMRFTSFRGRCKLINQFTDKSVHFVSVVTSRGTRTEASFSQTLNLTVVKLRFDNLICSKQNNCNCRKMFGSTMG